VNIHRAVNQLLINLVARGIGMINRRKFGGGLVGISARGIAGSYVAAEQETSANSFMQVGGDYHGVVGGNVTSKENLEYNNAAA
jgi:hypothetical protein